MDGQPPSVSALQDDGGAAGPGEWAARVIEAGRTPGCDSPGPITLPKRPYSVKVEPKAFDIGPDGFPLTPLKGVQARLDLHVSAERHHVFGEDRAGPVIVHRSTAEAQFLEPLADRGTA